MTAAIHSIWLMPAAGDAALLRGLVSDLSRRFGTPAFEPHLTVRGDTDLPLAKLTAAIEDAARGVAGFAETVAAIETSKAYFRSFYARFAVAPPLAALKARLDGHAAEPFMPHVSLLYGEVTAEAKAAAAEEVGRGLAGRRIGFERLCVVTSGQDIPIAQWRVVATASLA